MYTTQQFQQNQSGSPAKHLPGYTGYKPQYSQEDHESHPIPRDLATNSRIPGYCGYIPGVKAENVFGESYGKSSGQSGRGEITRGFDLQPTDKFQTVAQNSFQNQRELYIKMRAQQNSPRLSVQAHSIDVSAHLTLPHFRRYQGRCRLSSSAWPNTRCTR
jgi:hypothetical protein